MDAIYPRRECRWCTFQSLAHPIGVQSPIHTHQWRPLRFLLGEFCSGHGSRFALVVFAAVSFQLADQLALTRDVLLALRTGLIRVRKKFNDENAVHVHQAESSNVPCGDRVIPREDRAEQALCRNSILYMSVGASL